MARRPTGEERRLAVALIRPGAKPRTLRASQKVRNEVASAIAAIEHCKDPRVLDVILQRVNAAADEATGADDVTQFRLVAAIAERRLSALRS